MTNFARTLPDGISTGNETLVYDEGAWSPAIDASFNLGGTISIGAATYTRIGNTVFARITGISGLTISTANAFTAAIMTSTGLPGVVNGTYFSGTASVLITAAPNESLTISIDRNSSSNTRWQMSFGATSGAGVVNGDGIDVSGVQLQYKI